jgi:stalled ribosome rescue protein Dom34
LKKKKKIKLNLDLVVLDTASRLKPVSSNISIRRSFMKMTVALWIDYRKAVIVFVRNRDAEIKLIYSNVEKQYRQSSASVPTGFLRERELTGYLNNFYDEVISSLWNSGAIFIMGPGEAKSELKKHLDINSLNGRIVEVETVDRMTDRQIVAKALEYSLKQSSVVGSRYNPMEVRT